MNSSYHLIDMDYRGAALSVRIDEGDLVLLINGLERAREPLPHAGGTRLGSTVQTDYEWHEYIEVVLTRDEDSARVELIASSASLATETLEPGVSTT